MLTRIAKWMLVHTPYSVSRSAVNRFQGIEHCLAKLRDRGFYPDRVVDGGAHLGSFSLAAVALFPRSKIHMIEPQPACRASLERLATERGFIFHACALSSTPGTVKMFCEDVPQTGAFVPSEGMITQGAMEVPANTLDALFAADPTPRTLLKLDLQGHEMVALSGGAAMLKSVDVVITEVSFFQQVAEPTIPQLVDFFDAEDFDLYDIAALSGRARDDRLRQGDFVFVRRSNALVKDKDWA